VSIVETPSAREEGLAPTFTLGRRSYRLNPLSEKKYKKRQEKKRKGMAGYGGKQNPQGYSDGALTYTEQKNRQTSQQPDNVERINNVHNDDDCKLP
jgi:hypothetical protein